MASGYEMKARPAPPLTTLPMSVMPVCLARLPKMPNVMQPAMMDEHESMVVMMTMSLGEERDKQALCNVISFSLTCKHSYWNYCTKRRWSVCQSKWPVRRRLGSPLRTTPEDWVARATVAWRSTQCHPRHQAGSAHVAAAPAAQHRETRQGSRLPCRCSWCRVWERHQWSARPQPGRQPAANWADPGRWQCRAARAGFHA